MFIVMDYQQALTQALTSRFYMLNKLGKSFLYHLKSNLNLFICKESQSSRSLYPGHCLSRGLSQLDLFYILEDISPIIQKAFSVLTDCLGVPGN